MKNGKGRKNTTTDVVHRLSTPPAVCRPSRWVCGGGSGLTHEEGRKGKKKSHVS